jgi:MFS family permease
MGFMLMLGAIVGFRTGGWAVDRYGTRSVFIICHLAFGLAFMLFLLREWLAPPIPATMSSFMMRTLGFPLEPLPLWLGVVHFVYGGIMSASGIAVTTEMFGIIPRENKAFASGICTSLLRLSLALSGMLSAWVLDAGLLVAEWRLAGLSLSAYDSLLLFCGIMVVLLVVTLGLVPSVMGKHEWFPGTPD